MAVIKRYIKRPVVSNRLHNINQHKNVVKKDDNNLVKDTRKIIIDDTMLEPKPYVAKQKKVLTQKNNENKDVSKPKKKLKRAKKVSKNVDYVNNDQKEE